MRLDRVAIVLRPRGAWEGLDLGFAMARAWLLPLWLLWWCAALPVGLACLVLTGFRPDLWLLAVWWLKPLYEGPLVAWVGRALFGEPADWRRFHQSLRAGWPRRLLPYLAWRRLGPRRSFLMPLTLLEDSTGNAARDRRRLMNEVGGAPLWLTLVCYHFELILWLGLLLGLFFLVPSELPRLDLLATVTDAGAWSYWLGVLLYLFVFSFIAPFYVCAGFALYLTRRTDLEAWDLELAFRKSRAGEPGAKGMAAMGGRVGMLFGAVLAGWLLLAPSAAVASTWDPDRAQALIGEVLAEPDFGSMVEVSYWVPIDSGESAADGDLTPPRWLLEALLGVARVVKWSLLVAAVLLVTLLLLRVLRDWRSRPRPVRAPAPSRSPTVRGRDGRKAEVPPTDVPGAVRERLRAGDRRGALSLLYRASLLHLEGLGVRIQDAATESECLVAATRDLSADALGPLVLVIGAWQRLAYAHETPSSASVEELLRLWCDWAGTPGVRRP